MFVGEVYLDEEDRNYGYWYELECCYRDEEVYLVFKWGILDFGGNFFFFGGGGYSCEGDWFII